MSESNGNQQRTGLKDEDKKFLAKLRDEFRRWYGRLSVTELISNERLVKEIEAIERMFGPVQGMAL